MSKILIITDTHHGIKNDNIIIHDTYKKFYSEILFPYIKENNIEYMFHLGDVFDKRHHITGLTLKRFKDDFLLPLSQLNIESHFIVGNHDSYYKNTLFPNYVTDIISEYNDKIFVYDKPNTVYISGKPFDFIPWICKENYDETMNFIKNSKSHIALAHLELSGFQMYKGHAAKSGMSAKIFERYHSVFTGHYHTRSSDENIHYLGTPFDFTWADYNDPKGFHVFDTETLEIKFIQSPLELHKEIYYNETDNMELVIPQCEGKIVKIICNVDYKKHDFDVFKDKLAEVVLDYSVVDYTETIAQTEIETDEIKVMNTIDIFKKYLGDTDEETDNLINEIYQEALSLK